VEFREIGPPFLIVLQEWLLEAIREAIAHRQPRSPLGRESFH
jgi:hypothetical protein